MNDRIQNVEKYVQDVRNYFKNILEGRFLSLEVEKMNDYDMINAIPYGRTDDYRGISFVNNLCSWYTIGESVELEYFRPYKQICLNSVKGNDIKINYSRFWTPLSLKDPRNIYFGNKTGINTIDDIQVDPQLYFKVHYGEKILYIRGQEGIDQFGNKRYCYQFALKNVSPHHIRKYILSSQLFVLSEVIKNPIEYSMLPETTIIIEFNGQTTYNHHIVGHHLIYELVNRIYIEEFSEAFKSKYQSLLSKNLHILSL